MIMSNWGFGNSPNTERILEFFEKKYCKELAPVGLLKVCSIASSKINMPLPKFNVFVVAPTRQFKSKTTNDACGMFKKSYYLKTGSDFTIFTLTKLYRENKLKDKCIVVNDGTVLFSTKAKRTKDRLIGGLSELLADGEYIYGERLKDEVIKGKFSMIMNMTVESYDKYKYKLSSSTFLERFLTVYYNLPYSERKKFSLEFNKRIKMKSPPIKFKRDVVLLDINDLEKISKYAHELSILSLKSYQGTFDALKSLIITHCAINNRDHTTDDDYNLLEYIKHYVSVPGNTSKIMKCLSEGKSVKEICDILGKSYTYRAQIYRIMKKAKQRGIL